MVDDVVLNPGLGGVKIKTDDDGTAHWQYVKLAWGADNTQTRVTTSAPLPVDLRTDNLAGNLDVNIAAQTADITIADGGNSITVDNGGTFVIQEDGAALTALQTIDNIVAVDDAAFTAGSGSGVPLMAFATSDSVDSGDIGAVAMDTARNLKVSIEADNAGIGGGTQYAVDTALGATPTGTLALAKRDDALSALTPVEGDAVEHRVDANGALWVIHNGVLSVDDNGGSLTVDGTVTANLSATDNAVLDQIEVNTSYGDQTGGGAEASALRVTIANDSTGVLSIDDNGGSITIDGTVTASNTAGDIAHDSADSGNPVKIGAKAEISPKGITLVADGDRSDLYCDADGFLLTKHVTGADHVDERVSDTAGTSAAFSNFSAVASTYNYVTAYSIANTSSTDGYVDFRDGTAGSVLWTVPIPGNSGANLSAGGSPLFKTSANTALAYDVSAALTTVYISLSGYQSKV